MQGISIITDLLPVDLGLEDKEMKLKLLKIEIQLSRSKSFIKLNARSDDILT